MKQRYYSNAAFEGGISIKLFPCQLPAIFVCLITMGFYAGCTSNEDLANPLAPENLRTAGSPVGLALTAGDRQMKVSWQDLELEGIVKYRIYRQFTGDPNATFELVGEVNTPETEFIDKDEGLINDAFNETQGQQLFYIYRISYVDQNGIETPNPEAPPSADEDPRRVWPTARATPSVSPPAPTVILGDPTDLTVKLFWQDYQLPNDFAVFRVLAAISHPDGRPLEFEPLRNAELTGDKPFYFDSEFDRDEITKVYRVVAVDLFGVEGMTQLSAQSPNLPPAPPQNVRGRFRSHFGSPVYDALLSWQASEEADLKAYLVYSTLPNREGPVARREVIQRRNARIITVTLASEERLLVGQEITRRQYFVTAFDNTPRPDGSRDESPMVEAK